VEKIPLSCNIEYSCCSEKPLVNDQVSKPILKKNKNLKSTLHLYAHGIDPALDFGNGMFHEPSMYLGLREHRLRHAAQHQLTSRVNSTLSTLSTCITPVRNLIERRHNRTKKVNYTVRFWIDQLIA
jgi:hypothetical protein